jgi:hypothetical protein
MDDLEQEFEILVVHVIDQIGELFVKKHIPHIRREMGAVHDKSPEAREVSQYEVRRESCQRSPF